MCLPGPCSSTALSAPYEAHIGENNNIPLVRLLAREWKCKKNKSSAVFEAANCDWKQRTRRVWKGLKVLRFLCPPPRLFFSLDLFPLFPPTISHYKATPKSASGPGRSSSRATKAPKRFRPGGNANMPSTYGIDAPKRTSCIFFFCIFWWCTIEFLLHRVLTLSYPFPNRTAPPLLMSPCECARLIVYSLIK